MQCDQSTPKFDEEHEEQHRLENYRAAQRAAVEAIHVGRATADVVERQGEQLRRTDQLADETQYQLDKATRLLKGMTWTGRVSNWFTAAPSLQSIHGQRASSSSPRGNENGLIAVGEAGYVESFPVVCHQVAQAMQNYHCNLTVLIECETEYQKETCRTICDDMYRKVVQDIAHLEQQQQQQQSSISLEAYVLQFQADLKILRHKQEITQSQVRGLEDTILDLPDTTTSNNDAIQQKRKTQLFERSPDVSSSMTQQQQQQQQQQLRKDNDKIETARKSRREQQQDDHLAFVSASLGELGHLAGSLQEGLQAQNLIMTDIDNKADHLHESSRMVTRRTDRLIQTKSWTPAKTTFVGQFAVRHIESGKYLASATPEQVILINQWNKAMCMFRFVQRQSSASIIVGVQHEQHRKWLGQSFLTGALQCSGNSMGRRQEFELDSDWDNTRLVCVSAKWGQGGYLRVHPATFVVSIAPWECHDQAARWRLVRMDGAEEGVTKPATQN